MTRILLRIVAVVALLAPSLAFATEAIHGVWVREGHPEDKLEFYDCSGKLCAKGVQPLPDGTPAPIVLRNAAKVAANNWKGDLFNPENSKIYKGEITLDSQDQLTLTGCLVAFLCQSETWTRVSGPPPKPAAAHPAPKSGEAKSDDSKAGDAKAGAAKTGEAKTGESKSGDPKSAKGAGHEPAKSPSQEAPKAAAKPKTTPTKPKVDPDD